MIWAAALLTFANLPGQNQAGADPVIHAFTRLVQVNVIVHNKNFAVSDLKKDDFVVLDRGNHQVIRTFSVSNVSGKEKPAHPLPPNTFSNREGAGGTAVGGVTIILLDRLNTLNYSPDPRDKHAITVRYENQALAFAKVQLEKFLKDGVDPKDRIALYSLGAGLTMLCDFTSDPEQLQKALSKFHAWSITQGDLAEPGHESFQKKEFTDAVNASNPKLAAIANGDRASTTLAALAAIAHRVAYIPGRKNLIWLTASPPFSGAAAARIVSTANLAVYPVDARGLVTGQLLENSSFRPPGLDTMQDLADATGGRAFLNTNDLRGSIRKAVDDSDVIYTLGFYPDSDSVDGTFHELKVRVNKPGLEVRYPHSYFAFKEEPASDAQIQSNLLSAALSPLQSSSIPLTARVERVNDPKPASLRVWCSIDVHNLQLVEDGTSWKGSVDIFIVQQDAAGQILDKLRDRFDLQLTKDQYAGVLKRGALLRRMVQPKEGLATLRVLVSDPASQRTGSLFVPLSQVK